VPAWSPEIAKEIIGLAEVSGKLIDQMRLQELVYIAHGWCLAITGQPLTGDRPEALEHGPEYKRLAEMLAPYGVQPLTSTLHSSKWRKGPSILELFPRGSQLSSVEREIVCRTYGAYGTLKTPQLALLTRAEGTPWDIVFAGGGGDRRDIPHKLIRAQFEQIAAAPPRRAGPS
jgi:uncharacterized phage-associated protein